MKKLSLPSSATYLYVASGCLAFLFALSCYSFLSKINALQEIEERISFLQGMAQKKATLAKKEEAILSRINGADPSYLKKVVGSIHFMEKEKHRWTIFLSQIEPTQAMQERADFLDKHNKLRFLAGESRKTALFTETFFRQKDPIELGEEDLKHLLTSIEGVPISPYMQPPKAPQLLITSFVLEKKEFPGTQDKSYGLSLELLERCAPL